MIMKPHTFRVLREKEKEEEGESGDGDNLLEDWNYSRALGFVFRSTSLCFVK